VDNTLKYGEKTSQIKLSHVHNEGNLKLIYEDNGVGIPPDMKTKLFTKGHGKGTGLGLYLIKKTLEVYGWQIQETGTERKGAKFEITIPEKNRNKPNYKL
jgi:signal transduction histidine kinase